ncbi:hypothetical protein OJF2_67880 [Aquisphaera giovannonii]|uniref:Uncharacterized protein n=2 Tax=Aquisphaera giovannonii TaxID=406548 RepID=A0A5B9WE69_9BACT|nr:hypothetical protein OJF2_67880 [Aquisphaera giovannonii]
MTEGEWMSTAGPWEMLEFLRGKESPRRFRLLACALVRSVPLHRDGRSIWELVPAFEWFRDPIPGGRLMTCHELVEIAEREADGEASAGDWAAAKTFARAVLIRAEADASEHDPALGTGIHYRGSALRLAAAEALVHITEEDPDRLCLGMLDYQSLNEPSDRRSRDVLHPDMATPTRGLIREVFGDHPRPRDPEPARLPPEVTRLAGLIYAEQAFDRMPELGAALAAAGCHRADILSHCRSRAGHVRGCWALDDLRESGLPSRR